MKKYLNLSIVLILFQLIFVRSAYAETIKILAFGDSLTQGYQRSAPRTNPYACGSHGNGARRSCGYGNELEADVNSGSEHTALVYNWGYAGENTPAAVRRIDSVLNSRKDANFILIWEGANDYLGGISSTTTKALLTSMVQKAKAKGIIPILGTLPPNSVSSNNYAVKNDYNPKIAAVGREQNVEVVDMYTALGGIAGWPKYHSGDGLHINNAGYHAVAAAWYRTIKELNFGLTSSGDVAPIINLLLL